VTITNPYYEFTPEFVPATKARSDAVNVQYQLIQNAFDLLPSDSAALTTDTATFAPESGTGNAYVVTMPDTRTSNQDGDAVRFFATHSNTGSATLAVDAIGAVALVNWTGTVLGGGEIISGRIYEIRYDATNVQFVISASTDGAIQVGYAEEWAIKAEDVPISVAAGGDGVTDFSAFHWAQKAQAGAVSGRVLTDINTATPPTTEGVTGAHEIWDADQTDLLQRLGFIGSNELILKNYMHGGDLKLAVETAAGVEVPYKFSDTRMAIPNAVGVTFDDSGAVERESLILEGGSGGDTFWTEVEASADMEGADGATSYTELSLNLAVATFHGGAELDTAQFQSGTSSLLLDRSLDSFISFPDIPAFDFGTKEWTLEGWVRFASLPAIGTSNDPGYCMASIWDDAGVKQLRYEIIRDVFGTRVSLTGNGFAELGTISGGVALNTWFHWAVTRDSGGDINAYFNGIQETSDFGGAPADMGGSAAPLRIGQSDGIGRTDFMDGWIDDVRLTIGTARYTGTGSITPDSTPFPTSGPADAFKVGSAAIQTVIRGSGDDAAQTISAATGGMEVNNALTGAGMERVLTASDLSTGILTAPVIALVDINTATPPTTEGVTGAYELWDADETDLLGRLGYVASNDLLLSNLMHNGEVRITGEDSGGTTRTFFQADPNSTVDITAQTSLRLFIDGGNNAIIATGGAGVDLYHNNVERFGTGADGEVTVRSDDNVQSSDRLLGFAFQDGTRQGFIGHLNGSVFHIRSESHGQTIDMQAEDAGGIVRTIISGDPDSDSFVRATRHFTIQTNINEDALVATQNADTALYFNDIKKLRTDAFGAAILANINTATPPTTEVVNGRLWFRDLADNDDLGYVGYQGSNVLLIQNLMHAGKIAFQAETTAGVSRKMLELLPNGGPSVTLLEVGVAVVQSKTAATGGLEINNTLTGGGFERVLTTSDIAGGVQLAVKKADTSRSSTITLTDDPDLAITVDGTAYYAVTIHGHVTCAAAGIDMKYALDGATGRLIQALMTYAPETSTLGGVAIFGESTDQASGGTIDLDGVFQYSFTYTGYVYFSTGGAGTRTIEFTWAQNISNVTAVVLKEGSWMTVQKLADF
jgi:hypothetical protein